MSLNPCPFCGGRAEYKSGVKVTGYVMCLKCEVMGPNLVEQEAVSAWNNRAQRAEVGARQMTPAEAEQLIGWHTGMIGFREQQDDFNGSAQHRLRRDELVRLFGPRG